MNIRVTKNSWAVIAACFTALALAPIARAQMGDVGMAMGAGAALATTPLGQATQQTQAAAALAAGQPAPAPAPAAATGAPAAASPATAPAAASAPAAIPAPAEPPETDLHAPFRQSLFFSPQDIIAIKKASETPKNVVIDPNTGNVQTPVIPMNRFIAVSGISYKGPDNWVVWINGRKVVKGGEGVLKELVEIKPQKDYVDMLWFDIGLNGTIKIRMRPNQTYYIVPGLLLPGVAQQ